MRSWRHICINMQSSLINYLYKNIRTVDIQYAELMENLLLYGFEYDFLFAFYSTEKLSDEIDFILVSFFFFEFRGFEKISFQQVHTLCISIINRDILHNSDLHP